MSLFTESELRKSARTITTTPLKVLKSILLEEVKAPIEQEFDIFLSHSYLDADLILGLKSEIENMGFSVFVDWVEDQFLERENVSKATAELLREIMKNCRCLFFATSENSEHSKWMPWECGYFDGIKGKVAICPITAEPTGDEYEGQEYLGLYPYIAKNSQLWVHESRSKYVTLKRWLQGENPTEH